MKAVTAIWGPSRVLKAMLNPNADFNLVIPSAVGFRYKDWGCLGNAFNTEIHYSPSKDDMIVIFETLLESPKKMIRQLALMFPNEKLLVASASYDSVLGWDVNRYEIKGVVITVDFLGFISRMKLASKLFKISVADAEDMDWDAYYRADGHYEFEEEEYSSEW